MFDADSETVGGVMSAQPSPHTRGIGWAIRKVRKAQKRTLEDLAAAIGTDAGNLSRIEHGKQQITEPTLLLTAAELRMSVSELYRIAETGGNDDSGVTLVGRVALMDDEQKRQVLKYAEFLMSLRE